MQVDSSSNLDVIDPDLNRTLVIFGKALDHSVQRAVLSNIFSFVDNSSDLISLWRTSKALAPYAKARLYSGEFFPTTRLSHLMVSTTFFLAQALVLQFPTQ